MLEGLLETWWIMTALMLSFSTLQMMAMSLVNQVIKRSLLEVLLGSFSLIIHHYI